MATGYEESIVQKIDNGVELTEDELKKLVSDYQVDYTYGYSDEWDCSITIFVKLCERSFAIDCAATPESQPHGFYCQPYEVKLNTYEKTITVKEWVNLNKE